MTNTGVKHTDPDGSEDLARIHDLVLLTQAGYLTIKSRSQNAFLVGYPNKEVAVSLAELYCEELLNRQDPATIKADTIVPALNDGDVRCLFESANRAFAALDFEKYPIANEEFVRSCLQVFIAVTGFSVRREAFKASDRSILEVDAETVRWAIDLKFLRQEDNADALLEEAVRQIRERNDGTASSQPLIRAAAVFSEEKRAFIRWQNADTKSQSCRRHRCYNC